MLRNLQKTFKLWIIVFSIQQFLWNWSCEFIRNAVKYLFIYHIVETYLVNKFSTCSILAERIYFRSLLYGSKLGPIEAHTHECKCVCVCVHKMLQQLAALGACFWRVSCLRRKLRSLKSLRKRVQYVNLHLFEGTLQRRVGVRRGARCCPTMETFYWFSGLKPQINPNAVAQLLLPQQQQQ